MKKKKDDQSRMDTTGSSTDSRTAPANQKAATFTPGPWRVGERSNGHGIDVCRAIGAPVRVLIAHVSTNRNNAEANARLIAAAPDLYAALRKVQYGGEAGSCPECGGRPHMELCDLAAAIAKAEGC